MGEREQIARIGLAVHGDARKPERQRRLELPQRLLGAGAAGHAVGDDQPDIMAARDLLAREIEHMAEQAADRRTEHVQDVEWFHRASARVAAKSSGSGIFRIRVTAWKFAGRLGGRDG